MGRQKERKSEAWEEEIIKEEETGGIRGRKSKFVGGKYREGDECKGEEKRGINESGKNGEVEVEGEGEEKQTRRKETVQRMKKRIWKQKMKTKKRMENDREVDGRKLMQVDDLQRPGADLIMLWFVEQIAGLTENDLSQQDVQAME